MDPGKPNSKPAQLLSTGFLMPLVALYGSNDHPYKDVVQRAIRADAACQPDLVMVMGTSQPADGIWRIIPHLTNGVSTVIFVDKQPPLPALALSGHLTHYVQGKPDDWANMLLDGWDDAESFLAKCIISADEEEFIAPNNTEIPSGM